MQDSLQHTIDSLTSLNQNSDSNSIDLFIILVVSIATLIQVGATFGVNLWLHRRTFKDEYHQKLIVKRLEACERVEKIISHLEQTLIILDDNGKIIFKLFFDANEYVVFSKDLHSLIGKSLYLTNPLLNRVVNFSNWLEKKEIPQKTPEQIRELGLSLHKEFIKFHDDVNNLLYKELKSLYKIEEFIEQKERGKPKKKKIKDILFKFFRR